MVRLDGDPIESLVWLEAVRSAGAGALAQFLGTVRDRNRGRRVRYLEYHAYESMALAEMQRIEERSLARFDISSIALVHRTGRLEIGEISVLVTVAAPHRGDAFAACRFAIDELKRTVPIWKKEFFEGGEVWIEGAGETAPD